MATNGISKEAIEKMAKRVFEPEYDHMDRIIPAVQRIVEEEMEKYWLRADYGYSSCVVKKCTSEKMSKMSSLHGSIKIYMVANDKTDEKQKEGKGKDWKEWRPICTADIRYPRDFDPNDADKASYTKNRVAVAHELGHMLLHVKWDKIKEYGTDAKIPSLDDEKDREKETQAHYFALEVIDNRTKELKNTTYVKTHSPARQQVKAIIKQAYPGYDENLL